MAREILLNGRRYWVLSEPCDVGWRAWVVEVVDPVRELTDQVGLEATAETRGTADLAAEQKLRRLLQLPSPKIRS